MERIKKFMKSFKSLSTEWSEGVCKDLDDLGYNYEKNKIKRYYKKRFLKSKYIPGESIKTELESLKKDELVKPNLKRIFINNKKKTDALNFELHKNKHLLLLNGSLLDLSYKECRDISEKRKDKDYHFDFLLEDLHLQVFYEERKLSEINDRIQLLLDRNVKLEKLIELKKTNNEIIDSFMNEFHETSNSNNTYYQYEIEASNLLNEKKYSNTEIINDVEDLESSKIEYTEMIDSRDKVIMDINNIKEQITKVESIIDLTSSEELSDEKKKKEFIKKGL